MYRLLTVFIALHHTFTLFGNCHILPKLKSDLDREEHNTFQQYNRKVQNIKNSLMRYTKVHIFVLSRSKAKTQF